MYAQFNLGRAYNNGRGVEQSDEKAVEWFRRAANQGDADAQFELGCAYDSGKGVKKDAEEAVKWYRKAAEQGDADGACSLGQSLLFGIGIEKDEGAAFHWFQCAAEGKEEPALAWLGYCYDFGAGTPVDKKKAETFFSKLEDPAFGYNGIAWGLFEASRASEALPFAENAVAAFRKDGAFPLDGKIAILDTLAAVLDALERADETKKVCSEILSLMQDGDDSENREVALVRLGRACQRLGDKAGATDAWSKALAIVEKHGGKHARYGESADELRRLIREHHPQI